MKVLRLLWDLTLELARGGLRSVRSGRTPQQKVRYVAVEDFPESLEPATVYVAGVWGAALLCPCGCGDVIELNLLGKVRPHWRVREHWDHSASVTPSVWRRRGCRSHFFVRKGKIEWCGPDTHGSPVRSVRRI